MTTFFLDLWQDLRAKRLWPIAVGLLVATVAVPMVLSKPPSAPPPAGPAQANGGAKLPTVALDASSVDSSHLNIFKEKNPFKALADKTTSSTNTGTSAPVGSSVANAASSAGGSSSGSGAGSGSGSGGSGGSGTTPPAGPDGKPVAPGLHYFTYTADVLFGPRSAVKTYKSVSELDVLPDGKSPIISFMGVKGGNTAMFFIADPAFKAQGEGTCQPTPENCVFLYLKKDAAHNEETLSAQNGQVEYTLKLTGLHIKSLSASKAVGSTTPDKSPKAKKTRKQAAKVRNTLLSMPAVALARR